MRIIFFIIVILHGLLHVLGFLKSFGTFGIGEFMVLPISETAGTLWLLSAVLIVFYGFSFLDKRKYSFIIGFTAVLVSQVLITCFWTDASFGTIPNVLILIGLICSFACFNFNRKTDNETNQLISDVSLKDIKTIGVKDIRSLPKPIKRWIQSIGILGKEEIKIACIKQKAKMKMKPDQTKWYQADAIQYIITERPSFIWKVGLKIMPLLRIVGRDKYINGKGEMLIKLNSLFNVVNEKGDKIDEGTLQRYLGELVWTPSLAINPLIEWEEIDDFSAKAKLNYQGVKGEGTFFFNQRGDFVKFSTMRYMENKPDSKRFPWIISVDEYTLFDGIKIPSKMKATWKLDKVDWTWLELKILDVKYNQNAI